MDETTHSPIDRSPAEGPRDQEPRHVPIEAGEEPIPVGKVPSGAGKPLLARYFAATVGTLEGQTGNPHHGAMPDVELDPDEITPDLAAELRGMTVAVPAIEEWGVFEAVRPLDHEGEGWEVLLDDRTLEVPRTARLHVSSRAWREAGGDS